VALAVPALADADGPRPWRRQATQAVLILASAGVALGGFALVNLLMGQSYLPNSVLAKGQGINGGGRSALRLDAILERLTSDPLLATMVVVIAGAVAVGWRQQRRYVFPAIVFLVATGLHVVVAQMGWYERYQAYLVALGVVVLLAIAAETVPAWRRAPARAFLVPVLTLLLLLLCATKVSLTVDVPLGVQDTYQQRYQAARFLAEYYDGRAVATSELGYISLEHEGPLTDVLGLGDFDVLQDRRALDQRPDADYWQQLGRDRGFEVAVVYPFVLLFNAPPDWTMVASLRLDHEPVTAFQGELQFWATDPSEVDPLIAHLREFETTLPAGVTLVFDPAVAER
jgi:hypothetical protein